MMDLIVNSDSIDATLTIVYTKYLYVITHILVRDCRTIPFHYISLHILAGSKCVNPPVPDPVYKLQLQNWNSSNPPSQNQTILYRLTLHNLKLLRVGIIFDNGTVSVTIRLTRLSNNEKLKIFHVFLSTVQPQKREVKKGTNR
jgi:hypothetical protein